MPAASDVYRNTEFGKDAIPDGIVRHATLQLYYKHANPLDLKLKYRWMITKLDPYFLTDPDLHRDDG
jgi:hypothetical protein